MTPTITNILLVGVGGQGIILASEILSDVAMRSGLDSRKSEVHGMSQRGGVVSSHVRFGPKVYSALIEEGHADIICSFEILEASRWLYFLKPGGRVITSTETIVPPIAIAGISKYPDHPAEDLRSRHPEAILLPAHQIAQELGNIRLVNTIMMGKLSTMLTFPDSTWEEVIREMVPPKATALNLQAFQKGKVL